MWISVTTHRRLIKRSRDGEALGNMLEAQTQVTQSASLMLSLSIKRQASSGASSWSRVFVGAWYKTAPIHLLECRIALAAFVDCLNDDATSHGKDVILIEDNLAEVCCTSGGRVRDAGLNALFRRARAVQLSTGSLWVRRHVESRRNCTDEDARAADRGLLAPMQFFRGQGLSEYAYKLAKSPA